MKNKHDEEINSIKRDFSNRITYICKEMKVARMNKGITVSEVALRSGIGNGYVSDLENNKHPQIGLHMIMRFCHAIDEDYLTILMRADYKYYADKSEEKE